MSQSVRLSKVTAFEVNDKSLEEKASVNKGYIQSDVRHVQLRINTIMTNV